MPNLIDIPQSFSVSSPEALRRELESFAKTLTDWVNDTPQRFAPRLALSPINPDAAAFGKATRVQPLSAEHVVNVQLPRPDARNGGRELVLVRMASIGGVVLHGVGGALINGFRTAGLSAALGVTRFLFDGENYYSAPGTVFDWGGAP